VTRFAIELADDFSLAPPQQALLELDAVAGLPDEKLVRLRGIAEAALAGALRRDRRRLAPVSHVGRHHAGAIDRWDLGVERARRQRPPRPPRLIP
jgi:hypothetical protein